MVPAPKRRSSTLSSALAKDQASLQEHYLEFRIEEQPKTVQQIPEGLAGALVDPKLLGYPKSQIRVVWSQVVKGFVSQEEADTVLDMVCRHFAEIDITDRVSQWVFTKLCDNCLPNQLTKSYVFRTLQI